jgi:hypothetical protein
VKRTWEGSPELRSKKKSKAEHVFRLMIKKLKIMYIHADYYYYGGVCGCPDLYFWYLGFKFLPAARLCWLNFPFWYFLVPPSKCHNSAYNRHCPLSFTTSTFIIQLLILTLNVTFLKILAVSLGGSQKLHVILHKPCSHRITFHSIQRLTNANSKRV